MAKKFVPLSKDACALVERYESEIKRLRELCFDAYACLDVLGSGVGSIATPDGFISLWNETGVELERMGAKKFKRRMVERARSMSDPHLPKDLGGSLAESADD